MSVTLNSTDYIADTVTVANSLTTGGFTLANSNPVDLPGYVNLYSQNASTLLAMNDENGIGAGLYQNTITSVTLTIPANNSNITNNNKTSTLQNKTLSHTNNSLDVNRIRDAPVTSIGKVNTYLQYQGGNYTSSPYENSGTSNPQWVFTDTRATGTQGGNGIAGFNDRIITLNVAQSSSSTNVTNPTSTTVSFNAVGVYFVHAIATSRAPGTSASIRLLLADDTIPTTYYMVGLTDLTGNAPTKNISMFGTINVTTTPTVCRLQSYHSTGGTNALGTADSITGIPEVYVIMYIRQLR